MNIQIRKGSHYLRLYCSTISTSKIPIFLKGKILEFLLHVMSKHLMHISRERIIDKILLLNL